MELTGYTVSHSGNTIYGGIVETIKEVQPEYPSKTIPEILDNHEIRQVELRFDDFMRAAATKDSDAIWLMSYKELFSDKKEIDFFIETKYGYFENYSKLEIRESFIGELDGFSKERNPELADKTVAGLSGYINYGDGTQKYFDATFVQIEGDWELLSFEIFDKENGEGSSNQSTEETINLSIGNVRLCTEVIDADHYTLNTERTFLQGQMIYVLFEVNGISTKKLGRQHNIHLKISRMTMFDNIGNEIASNTEPAEVIKSWNEPIEQVTLWVYFGSPLEISDGEYMVEVEVTDEFTGEMSTTNESFSVIESPVITNNVHLCSVPSAPGNIVIQPNGLFAPGEEVFIYIETPGLALCEIDGDSSIWLKVTELKVYDAGGVTFLEVRNALSEKIHWDRGFMMSPYVNLTIPLSQDVANGDYLAEVAIEDGCTGDRVTESVHFTVEGKDTFEKLAL